MKHERQYYAEASTGYSEHNDCSVRALSVAACMPYSDAHAVFAKHGRRPRGRTQFKTVLGVMQELFPDVQINASVRGVTVATFVRQHPKGHFYIHVTGHAFAVVDGVIHDWSPRPLRRVKLAWQLA